MHSSTPSRLISTFPCVIGGLIACASGEVWACDLTAIQGQLNLPLFVIALVAVVVAVATLTTIVWLGMRFLLKSVSRISAAFVAALVMSIVLALIGSYALTRFDASYNEMGIDLPAHTEALVSMRYALMLPLFFIGANSALRSIRAIDEAFYLRFLAIESIFLALILWSIYSPIFKMC